MNDQSSTRAGIPELRNLAVGCGLLMVLLLAYAFAAGEWRLASEPSHEAELAAGWQSFGTPVEIDVAKRR